MENRINNIVNILNEKKSLNIDVIDLTNKQYIVDIVIIATTLNSKHAYSLITHLKNGLKPSNEEFLRIEENDEWTIIDLGDIIIHLMSENYRTKYKIEEFLDQIKKGTLE